MTHDVLPKICSRVLEQAVGLASGVVAWEAASSVLLPVAGVEGGGGGGGGREG